MHVDSITSVQQHSDFLGQLFLLRETLSGDPEQPRLWRQAPLLIDQGIESSNPNLSWLSEQGHGFFNEEHRFEFYVSIERFFNKYLKF